MSTSRKMFREPSSRRNRWVMAMICLGLALITVVAFASVTDNGFINLDDNRYVYENPRVQSGFNARSLQYAFSFDLSNWHPLTWLSLMVDYQIFGLNPAGYHGVNLLFHVINTLLLFLVLRRMTKALWPSALVAALFAIHPLHVESVAWVAERKDVLSGLFWMLTLGAYSYYVEKPGLKRYWPVLLFFILGLMSKPMLVTLPFVLLLLDYWPLKRFSPMAWSPIRAALVEKIPLFILTLLSCAMTFLAQKDQGAVQTLDAIPLFARLGNALLAYVAYIGKTIWPASLAVLYPHPLSVAIAPAAGAALFLAAVTAFVLWQSKKAPYLATGWFWFIGTLVPVIGLVQVGAQSMADRYTYIPLTGLFLIVAWGASDLAKKFRFPRAILPAVSAVMLIALALVTFKQVSYWKDNLTLYDRTLAVTEQNWLIYNNRGNVNIGQGDYRRAIEDYNQAISIKPDYADAYANRGAAYNGLDDFARAIADFNRAIGLRPGYAEAYINRGGVYNNMGNYSQAIEDLNRGIAIKPGYGAAYFSRGVAHAGLERYSQAIDDFSRAIDLHPLFTGAYVQRGLIYFNQGNIAPGCRDARKACSLGDCNLLEAAGNNGYCR